MACILLTRSHREETFAEMMQQRIFAGKQHLTAFGLSVKEMWKGDGSAPAGQGQGFHTKHKG